jgi:hypothetical protein
MSIQLNTVTGKVGIQSNADGSTTLLRQGKQGQLISDSLHGQYFESNLRTTVYTASNAVAGVAPGTALGTTPPIAIYNPINSGVNAVVRNASVGYVSGTLGAGSSLGPNDHPDRRHRVDHAKQQPDREVRPGERFHG